MTVKLSVGPGRTDDNIEFAQLMERYRRRMPMTRAKVAKLTYTSVEYIRRIEHAEEIPTKTMAARILEAYSVSSHTSVDGNRLLFDEYSVEFLDDVQYVKESEPEFETVVRIVIEIQIKKEQT